MTPVPRLINIRAYAKVNLTLEVLGRRPDRYHELRSVVQTVSLADEMVLRPDRQGTKLLLSGYPVPGGDDNLIMAAIRQVASRFDLERDLELRVRKNIPPGRGLGGGSSDAAAILRALGCLHDWAVSREALYGVAQELGSDVPLFLRGGTLLMAGRGERVQRLPGPTPDFSLVLTWPDLSIPTEAAYALLDPQDFSDGATTARLWEHLSRGEPPRPDLLCNAFERAVFARWPVVARRHAELSEIAGVPARLTGSGSGLFVITDQPEAVVDQLHARGRQAVAVHPVAEGHILDCRSVEGGNHGCA